MPKESKVAANRRVKRHSFDLEDVASVSTVRESTKSTVGRKRYSPFLRELPRKEARMIESSMTLANSEILPSRGNGIIGNGIKYIMFPLHLLRFCIFGTSTTFHDSGENPQTQRDRRSPGRESENENEKEQEGEGEVEREGERERKGEREGEGEGERERERERGGRREKHEDEEEDLVRDRRRQTEGEEEEEEEEEKEEKKKKKKDEEPAKSGTKDHGEKQPKKKEEQSSRNLEKKMHRPTSPESGTREAATGRRNEEGENDDSSDEMVTAEEDSDSSMDRWTTANNSINFNMNMSVDYDNVADKSMANTESVEPMDISMEEHTVERSYAVAKVARETRSSENSKKDTSKSPKSYDRAKNSSFSVDEEISRIFQKQCTSSEDEFCPSSSSSSSIGRVRRDVSYRGYEKSNSSVSTSRQKKKPDDEAERKKKILTQVGMSKRRKTMDEEAREKRDDRRSENGTKEEKCASRQTTPRRSNCKSRSSKTPVKGKESKRKIRYEEKGTQTDSAFSDEDVEMVPIEAKRPEKRFCCRHAARKSHNSNQIEEMDQDWSYVADNEDSNDGHVERLLRQRVSSDSASSSSTDLGFDERGCHTPEAEIRLFQWQRDSSDPTGTYRACTARAPPGFPQFPRNPPLTSCSYGGSSCYRFGPITEEKPRHDDFDSFIVQRAPLPSVPPAPTPMRHLYYDYPEFMDLPRNVQSSDILRTILSNGYYR